MCSEQRENGDSGDAQHFVVEMFGRARWREIERIWCFGLGGGLPAIVRGHDGWVVDRPTRISPSRLVFVGILMKTANIMGERIKPVRAPDLKTKKRRGEKITMLTAYDATMAGLLDRAGIDVLLVGDSLGMVVEGHDSTIPVTLDAMIHHTRAVSRGTKRALVVGDMPFMTYQTGVEDAVRNAGRLIQEGGAGAVKIEGGPAGWHACEGGNCFI